MNISTRRVLSLAIAASIASTVCFAQEARPVKPTDDIPTWKDAVERPMLAYSYPGWTPPKIMETPFEPPAAAPKKEELVCITVEEAQQVIEMCKLLAYKSATLDVTQSSLELANKRINYLEAENYDKDVALAELSDKYLKMQDELRKAQATIDELSKPK